MGILEMKDKSEFPSESATQPSVADPEHTHDRRERDRYDSNRFAEDLETALGVVKFRVTEARRTSAAQPHLPEGISMQDATLRVVESLVLRKLTGEFEELLDMVIDDARVMLLHKNAAYGDSALSPLRVFSTASLREQLLVRLDDKVSRLARGSAAGEDVAQDMLGYLLLVAIAEKREHETKETP